MDELVLAHLRAPGDVRFLRLAVELVLCQVPQPERAPLSNRSDQLLQWTPEVGRHGPSGGGHRGADHQPFHASSFRRPGPLPGTAISKRGWSHGDSGRSWIRTTDLRLIRAAL